MKTLSIALAHADESDRPHKETDDMTDYEILKGKGKSK